MLLHSFGYISSPYALKDARRQYRDAKTLFFPLVHQVQEVLGNKQLNPYRRKSKQLSDHILQVVKVPANRFS